MSEMSTVLKAAIGEVGKQLGKDGKPISTLAVLRELRTRGNCGAWKVLQQAELLFLDLPQEIDEGDSGIFSTSLQSALISAEFLAHGSRRLETQHVLRGLARQRTGAAGQWLREQGFEEGRVDWGQFSDPKSPAEAPPDLAARRLGMSFAALFYLGMAFDGPFAFFASLLGLLCLTEAVGLWSRVRGWRPDPERCARCLSVPEIPSMLDTKSGLCRPCERAIVSLPGRNWLLLLLVLVGVCAFYMEIYAPLGWALANLALAIPLTALATLMHELGHLVVGQLVGYRLVSLHLGQGDLRKGFKLGLIWVYWLARPEGALVMCLCPRERLQRWRRFMFALAGPGANFLAAGLIWWGMGDNPPWGLSAAWTQGLQPLWTFFFVHLTMGLSNLYPGSGSREGESSVRTDGKAALDALRKDREVSRRLEEQLILLQAQKYRKLGNPEAELMFFDRAVREPDRDQKLHRISLLSKLKRWREALEVGSVLREADPLATPERRSVELNALAWSHYMLGEWDEADRLSAECLELFPELSNNQGTRAEVLAARGHLDDAWPMLEKAIRTTLCAESAAHNCKALARIAALRGDEREFARLSHLGRKLALAAGAYPSTQAAVEDARSRGHWVPA